MRRSIPLLTMAAILFAASGTQAQQETAPPLAAPVSPLPAGSPPVQEPAPAPPPSPAPSLAPEPATAAPVLTLEPRTQTGPEASRPEPFYRKTWFWGALGVLLATTAVVLVASAGAASPATPNTTLGNKHGF